MSATQGSWEVLSYQSPILPIHAALLSPGTDGRAKVLFLAGSGNKPNNTGCTNCSAVWDYEQGTFLQPQTPLNSAGNPIDFFCAGQAFLADGRLLVMGGTEQYDPFQGLSDTIAFDPKTLQWKIVQSMASGRWYPTAVTLRDGNVFACSGKDESGLLDTYPEIYSPSTGWSVVNPPPNPPTSQLAMYSHLFLLRDGRLFYSGGYFESNNGVSPRILNLPTPPGTIAEQPVEGLTDINSRDQSSSVLLPPVHEQRVMIMGGGTGFNGTATKSVNIVQLSTAGKVVNNPTYKPAASLNYARMHHSAVLLPDRTVFVCGGSGMGESGDMATQAGEIYNPTTNTWTVVAREATPDGVGVNRLYHSVALLLPDGRVISVGGNPNRDSNELRISIYRPPYFFKGTRPVIDSAPAKVAYSASFQIQTSQARDIKWINLMRPSAATHSCDTEQRLHNVAINSKTSTTLNVTLTSNRNLVPPGFYMLFITDTKNVPSVAKWVQIMP
jgi:Domain of unknown function (DUF1929)/Kelch motif/Galactose oxidase, central domain